MRNAGQGQREHLLVETSRVLELLDEMQEKEKIKARETDRKVKAV